VKTLEGLARVCVQRDIPVLSDEIYEKLVYDGSEFRCFATFGEEVKQRTIIVSGVSKAYSMTGWRIGWTIAPLDVTKAMGNLQSQETSNPCSISQHAAVAALNGPQECVGQMLEKFKERRNYVVRRLSEIPGVSMAEPGGAFYAFFDVSSYFGKPLGEQGTKVTNSTDFCTTLLEQAHVALVSGDAFGAPGYARLSFATDMATIEQGLNRLAKFLQP
jgi:aspartate aminotransferase